MNFRFPQDAREFKEQFSGTPFTEERPDAIGWVHWRNPIQGFASHFDRFPQDAREFKEQFSGTPFTEERPDAIGWVHWRNPIQGFASHFDRYRGNYAANS